METALTKLAARIVWSELNPRRCWWSIFCICWLFVCTFCAGRFRLESLPNTPIDWGFKSFYVSFFKSKVIPEQSTEAVPSRGMHLDICVAVSYTHLCCWYLDKAEKNLRGDFFCPKSSRFGNQSSDSNLRKSDLFSCLVWGSVCKWRNSCWKHLNVTVCNTWDWLRIKEETSAMLVLVIWWK